MCAHKVNDDADVSGGTGQVTIGRWMITLKGRVISEGITPSFLTGLAAVFALYPRIHSDVRLLSFLSSLYILNKTET